MMIKSEFRYCEDIEMNTENALYQNDSIVDVHKTVVVTSFVSLLFVSLNTDSVYASSATDQFVDFNSCYIDNLDSNLENIGVKDNKEDVNDSYGDLISYIKSFAELKDNWDNAGSDAIEPLIIKNAEKFITTLKDNHISCPHKEYVNPSPYGTITIDSFNSKGFLSIEIGKAKIAFFTDYEDGMNDESDGILTDFYSIPDVLLENLKIG